jgi:hypothetical protein
VLKEDAAAAGGHSLGFNQRSQLGLAGGSRAMPPSISRSRT